MSRGNIILNNCQGYYSWTWIIWNKACMYLPKILKFNKFVNKGLDERYFEAFHLWEQPYIPLCRQYIS